jgi:hypothetical protein
VYTHSSVAGRSKCAKTTSSQRGREQVYTNKAFAAEEVAARKQQISNEDNTERTDISTCLNHVNEGHAITLLPFMLREPISIWFSVQTELPGKFSSSEGRRSTFLFLTTTTLPCNGYG